MESKRSSSRLERVPTPLQAETRTRSALSFDIDNATTDDSLNSAAREGSGHGGRTAQDVAGPSDVKSKQSGMDSPRSGLSRLSRKFLFNRTEPSLSESTSDSSRETSPTKRASRSMFSGRTGTSAEASPSAAGDKKPATESPKGERKSRSFFSPKNLSLLRISTKASDFPPAQQGEEDDGTKESPVQSETASSSVFATTESGDSSTAKDVSPSSAMRSGRMFKKSATALRLPDDMDPKLVDELELVLSDRHKRDRLVETLLAEHVDGASSKVRFMSAVGEFERTPSKTERMNKGKKILATFVQRDAPFPLSGLPREILAAANVDLLPLIRLRVAIDLLGNAKVAKLVTETAYAVEDELVPTSGDLV